MADNKNAPAAKVEESEEQGPFNRIADVPAGPTEGGPTNPTKDALSYEEVDTSSGARVPFEWEADPTKDVDLSSASSVAAANEAREAGTPLNQKSDDRTVDQGAATPAGTGTAAAPAAGTADAGTPGT